MGIIRECGGVSVSIITARVGWYVVVLPTVLVALSMACVGRVVDNGNYRGQKRDLLVRLSQPSQCILEQGNL